MTDGVRYREDADDQRNALRRELASDRPVYVDCHSGSNSTRSIPRVRLIPPIVSPAEIYDVSPTNRGLLTTRKIENDWENQVAGSLGYYEVHEFAFARRPNLRNSGGFVII